MSWLGDQHGAGLLGMVTPPVKDNGPSSWPQSSVATPSSRADANSKTITPSDQSIDQLLLGQVATLKAAPVPSVQLTASTESADQSNNQHALRACSYVKRDGANAPTPLWPEASPNAAFQNYFASGLMNVTPEQAARLTAQKKSLLDFERGAVSSLQSRAPRSELPKLQAHLDAIRQLEMSLAASDTTCTPPNFPDGAITPSPGMFSQPSPQGGYTNVGALDAQAHPIWMQQRAIIKTLFACDLTRVISFTFGYGNSGIHFQNGILKDPMLAGKYQDTNGKEIANPNGHHDISHGVGGGSAADAQYIIDKYYCDMTAGLLADLAATADVAGGSLLDNTLVVFFSEISDGNAHGIVDMPVLLFGGKFLNLNGGSYLKLGTQAASSMFSANGHYSKGPAPYTSDLWTTVAQAFGAPLQAYGDPSWNTGTIPGIFRS